MIEIPVDNTPSKQFSVNTEIGVLRFRTYWNNMLSMWYMDLLNPDGTNLLTGLALTTGTNNLIRGTGISDLEGCAIFVVDTAGTGNTSFDGFGTTGRVFMTFPSDAEILPY